MKLQTASAKNLSSSSSNFMLQACEFLHYFPAFIINCSDTGLKHRKAGSFMILQFLNSRNSTRKYYKKYYQKNHFMYFSVPQMDFLCAWESHCRTEIWLPRGWSLLEFIGTSAISYVVSFDVKDKTRVGLVFEGRGFTWNEDSQACSAQSPALESPSLWN